MTGKSVPSPRKSAPCPGRWLLPTTILLVVLLALPVAQEDEPHGEFYEDCTLCHSDEAFTPILDEPEFDHSKTGFPRTGAHALLTCRTCHVTLDFTKAEGRCVNCHQDVHRGEMGTDCDRCHTTRNFIDRARMMREHRLTRFPLIGAHMAVDCGDCHGVAASGQMMYVNTPAECAACHLDDYRSTTSPDHETLAFPTDCQLCHAPFGWGMSRFYHGVTGFNLTGSHAALDCTACHAGYDFTGASADCVSCHQQDYDQTTDPSHLAAGIPTDCADCHRTSSWIPARFNHGQYFPIYSGTHAGEWSRCSDCHINPADYTEFSCVRCHAHASQERMDREHDGVSGYVYDSIACYSCHPRGEED